MSGPHPDPLKSASHGLGAPSFPMAGTAPGLAEPALSILVEKLKIYILLEWPLAMIHQYRKMRA